MAGTQDDRYAANLEHYDELVGSYSEVNRKGKTMPYTSLNGHMFSFLDKAGNLALRLSKEDRELFEEQYQTEPVVQYGAVMKEYVAVPEELLAEPLKLKAHFDKSLAYVKSLKPKSTKN